MLKPNLRQRYVKSKLTVKSVIFEIYNVGVIYRESQRLKLELRDIKYQTAENMGNHKLIAIKYLFFLNR